MNDQPYGAGPVAVPAQVRSLVYLDVWRREVTHLQDPQLIEPAVNVDTTTRYQTAWQVKCSSNIARRRHLQTPFTDIGNWPKQQFAFGCALDHDDRRRDHRARSLPGAAERRLSRFGKSSLPSRSAYVERPPARA